MKLGDFQDKRRNLLRDSLRYNWLFVVFFILLGAVAGVGLGYSKVATYSSSTTVLANQIPGNPYTPESNSDTLEMLQTEAVAATSQTVVKQVIDDLKIDLTPDRLRSRTVVDVPPNTQALRITYTSTNRLLSTKIVDGIARAYLAQRKTQAEDSIKEQVTNLNGQLAKSQDALRAANAADDPNASAIRASIIEIQGRISTATSQSTDPGRVLTPGTAPSGSERRHLLIFGIAGLIVGTLAGLAFAMWRERRRDLIRSTGDLDDYAFEAPVTTIHGETLDGDALRHLRLRLSPLIRQHAIVALVGMAPGQALSVGGLLGNSLVAGGTSVALIDGTGTEPEHRDILGLGGKPGLAEALLSERSPATVMVKDDFGYLPAGTGALPASEHLMDEQAQTIVTGIAMDFDLTLIACLPLDNVEGEALARFSEGVILLVEPHKTSHFALSVALRSLSSQDLRLIEVFVLPPSR